jgi:hypothetical protein
MTVQYIHVFDRTDSGHVSKFEPDMKRSSAARSELIDKLERIDESRLGPLMSGYYFFIQTYDRNCQHKSRTGRLTVMGLRGDQYHCSTIRTDSINLLGEHCAICYNTFAAIIAEEEMIQALDTPVSERELGVTKLQKCGHYFCRKE